MNGTEDIGKVLLTAVIQIAIAGLTIVILYFVAYKPIKRRLSEYFQQNIKKDGEVGNKSPDKKERTTFDYVGEAEKTKKTIESKAVKVSNSIRQKIEREGRKTEEFISGKAKTQINEERDRAIGALEKEYTDLIMRGKGKSNNNKTE